MNALSIIGAGNVGKTVAKLLYDARVCEIRQILNRSKHSADQAARFIGAGEPIDSIADLSVSESDLLMVSTSDNAIGTCAVKLAEHLRKPVGQFIAFHCSGSMPSTILEPLRSRGAQIASVHPIKTFSNPQKAVASFRGTYCGVEGDESAIQRLKPFVSKIGGIVFNVETKKKSLYHAALVFICNYCFTIIESGLRCFEEAGVSRLIAIKAIEPILQETIHNALSVGPTKALTGPIARGDCLVVQKQVEALAKCDPSLVDIYVALAKETVALAKQKGVANEADLRHIARILDESMSIGK